MPQLFLVRHTEPRLTGVLLGQVDSPLSEHGLAHAATLLEGVALAMVYSSPLKRALETAKLIARGAPIEVIGDLREIGFGPWDGRTWADIEASDPEFAARKLHDWRGVTLPGAEPWSEFEARVQHAFERIRNGPRPAAVVAHAGVHNVLAQVDLPYGGVHEL
jgi:broad specificity phosphatase PhoE